MVAIKTLDVINRVLAAGRSGSFNKAVGGIGASITFGATSKAADDVEKFLEQVSSQKNKAGIEQNIQALNQLSNALTRIRPEDPNAGRAVALQGRIQQMKDINLAALQNLPKQTLSEVKIPKLGGGTGTEKSGGTGGGTTGQDLAALAQEQIQALKDQASLASALNEEEQRRFQLNIDLREIAENAKGFAEEDVQAQIAARIELEEKVNAAIAYKDAVEATARTEEKARKDRRKAEEDARKKQEADPLFQMQKQFTELIKLENQVAAGATSIGNAFSNAFGAVVTGSKTGQEALSGMLKSIASDFLGMAQKIIAQQLAMILYGTIMKALGVPMPGGGGDAGAKMSSTQYFNPQTGLGVAGPNFGRANGGPAKGGQPYMVGERGPELFVPGQSGGVMRNEDMRSLMGRSPASGGAASMNFSFETTSIGGTEYVSREQLESAMAVTRKQASNDGAKRGMNMTLDKMQNSPRTRTRIGLR